MKRRKPFRLFALVGGLLLAIPALLNAETNSVLGGLGGLNNGTLVGGDGTGSGQFTINIVDLALVKQARDPSGTVLPGGSNVLAGQQIYFVLYVDNATVASADDIRLDDQLDESQFTYIPNTLEVAVLPSGSNDAQIWTGLWSTVSDALGVPDDTGSILDTGGPPGPDHLTVGATVGQANQNAAVSAGSMMAVRFMVRVN